MRWMHRPKIKEPSNGGFQWKAIDVNQNKSRGIHAFRKFQGFTQGCKAARNVPGKFCVDVGNVRTDIRSRPGKYRARWIQDIIQDFWKKFGFWLFQDGAPPILFRDDTTFVKEPRPNTIWQEQACNRHCQYSTA